MKYKPDEVLTEKEFRNRCYGRVNQAYVDKFIADNTEPITVKRYLEFRDKHQGTLGTRYQTTTKRYSFVSSDIGH